MDIAAISIRYKIVTLVMTFVLLVGGFISYSGMGRLEDPEFTIKEALVVTPYPGATSTEVEEEVTNLMETQIQQMGQLSQVRSSSKRGVSTITVEIQDQYDRESLPQVWDELRRKVADAQSGLPPGARSSIVIDDYGDVYGIYLVATGDGYSYAELKEYVDLLKKELLLVRGVGKVTTFGEREEAIYVEFSRDKLSQLGLSPASIVSELNEKNTVVDAGRINIDGEFIAIEPSAGISTISSIENLLLSGFDGQQFRLKDVALIRRGYVEPQEKKIRMNGIDGIGIGISVVAGGNVIEMGEELTKALNEIEKATPIGIHLDIVSFQPNAVSIAIEGFVVSLIQAVVIVILVLIVFMGFKSAMIIGFVLLATISGSFIFLDPMGVSLERISLGALIIALGMLVDNAIVVVDGMLMRMQKGESPENAASNVVKQSQWALLGATAIAVLAFASIGTSNDSTGEFCRSLFQVVMVSLLLSWVTAITLTPLLGVMFLKAPLTKSSQRAPYTGFLFVAYKQALSFCLNQKTLSMSLVLIIFFTALWGFKFVDQSFFPGSTRAQFMVDVWLPQGSHIETTSDASQRVVKSLLKVDGVAKTTSTIGEGSLRFLLTYSPEHTNSSYAQILVDVRDGYSVNDVFYRVQNELKQSLPQIDATPYKFEIGPGGKGKIEARFQGDDPSVLRELAQQAERIFSTHHDARSIRTNWRQQTKVIRPLIAEEQANINGITREMVAAAIRQGFQGNQVGIYRDGDLLLPIIVRADEVTRLNVSSLESLQIWSPLAGEMIPIRQVVKRFEVVFENEIIERQDRKRSISVYADPIHGYASSLLAEVRTDIESIPLPGGYTLEWGGEFEDTNKAQGGLVSTIPLFVSLMVLITIFLFNSLKIPLIIWLCVPMAIVGVTLGLLSSGQPFGFMALLGFLSLIGMLIKNAIVLIDEINLQIRTGLELNEAILISGVSRLRPVSLAALTTALGMIPLITDAFFASMAVTIIGGLVFATILTMFVVPILYAVFFQNSAELKNDSIIETLERTV